MVKGFRLILFLLLAASISVPTYAQGRAVTPEKEFDTKYKPISLALRLSYENYKNIKLLHTAIINFGGGEAELDKLIDDYAQASTLFFSKNYIESANLFTKNEKEILDIAVRLAKKYKSDTETLHKQLIKMKVKTSLRVAMKERSIRSAWHRSVKETYWATMESIIHGGAHSLRTANDLEVRVRPVEAIYYYRRSKETFFKAFPLSTDHFSFLSKDARKQDEKEFYMDLAEKYRFPEKYKKDEVDNKNLIYEIREKKK
jgi:hypothetical protein